MIGDFDFIIMILGTILSVVTIVLRRNEKPSVKKKKKKKKEKDSKYFGETVEIPYDEVIYGKPISDDDTDEDFEPLKDKTKKKPEYVRYAIIFLLTIFTLFFYEFNSDRAVSANNKATKITESLHENGFDDDKYLDALILFEDASSTFLSRGDMDSYALTCANLGNLYTLKWMDSKNDTYFYQSEKYYNESAEIDTSNPSQYFNISINYYYKSGSEEDFEPDLQTAYKYAAFSYDRDNNYSKANWAMGFYYYNMWKAGYGDESYLDICEEYYETALSIDTEDVVIGTSLMNFYYERHDLNPEETYYLDKYNELYNIYGDTDLTEISYSS